MQTWGHLPFYLSNSAPMSFPPYWLLFEENSVGYYYSIIYFVLQFPFPLSALSNFLMTYPQSMSLWEARCLPVETGMAPIKRGAHKPEICQWSRHPSSSRLIKIFPWWQHMARRWKSFTLWPWHPLTGLVCGLPLKNLLKYPWWPVKNKIPPVSIYLTKCWIEKLNLLLHNPNHFSRKWSRETFLKFSSLPKKNVQSSACVA